MVTSVQSQIRTPNFINNCDLEAIKLVTREACRITVVSPQLSGVATVPLISYVYFPEFDEPDFHLKKYLKEGQYAFNNIKWSAMSAIFLKYMLMCRLLHSEKTETDR